MATVTIPKKMTRGEELVIIPRKEFEKLLKFPKRKKLDKHFEEALKDAEEGRLLGPFKTIEEFKKTIR